MKHTINIQNIINDAQHAMTKEQAYCVLNLIENLPINTVITLDYTNIKAISNQFLQTLYLNLNHQSVNNVNLKRNYLVKIDNITQPNFKMLSIDKTNQAVFN